MAINIHRFSDERSELIRDAIFYHLLMEGLLDRLLKEFLTDPEVLPGRLMFAQKLSLCRAIGKISRPIYDLIKKLNDLRNKFAHKLDYTPTFEYVHSLVQQAGAAGVDFSDDVNRSVEHARSLNYNKSLLLTVLFQNTFFDVAFKQNEEFWSDLLA